jgi:hypothetical protein
VDAALPRNGKDNMNISQTIDPRGRPEAGPATLPEYDDREHCPSRCDSGVLQSWERRRIDAALEMLYACCGVTRSAVTLAPPSLPFSQIQAYIACPLAWDLSRLYRPAFIPASRMLEIAFQATVKAFYQTRLAGGEMSLERLKAAYDTKWMEATEREHNPPIRYIPASDNPFTIRETAMRMLEAFFDQAKDYSGQLLAAGWDFTLPSSQGCPGIRDAVDLLRIASDGEGLEVVGVDFGDKTDEEGEAPYERLLLQALAVLRSGFFEKLGLPLRMRMDLVSKDRACSRIASTLRELHPKGERRLFEKIRRAWRGMSRQFCPPRPGWHCAGCGYQKRCAKSL